MFVDVCDRIDYGRSNKAHTSTMEARSPGESGLARSGDVCVIIARWFAVATWCTCATMQ